MDCSSSDSAWHAEEADATPLSAHMLDSSMQDGCFLPDDGGGDRMDLVEDMLPECCDTASSVSMASRSADANILPLLGAEDEFLVPFASCWLVSATVDMSHPHSSTNAGYTPVTPLPLSVPLPWRLQQSPILSTTVFTAFSQNVFNARLINRLQM